MNILAVLCVRNEGAFILDWLAHHLAVGVSHVLAFSNDCDDGTDMMLDRLAMMGHVTHLRNDGPYDRGGIQFTALKRADRSDPVAKADWLLPMDIDEFVNVHVGDHTIPALLRALPDATAIPLTWRNFGNAGVVRYTDVPVPQQFTRAAPVVMHWPWRSAMFKTLFANDGTYRNLGVHRPRNPVGGRIKQARWFDGEGRELPPEFHTSRIFSPFGRSNYALAQMNHYPLSAMESYLLKAARGRAVHSGQMLGLDYWVERNFNTDEDRSILALGPATTAIRAQFAADPVLAGLHIDAVTWRHARLEALMQEEPYRALMGRLLMAPPSVPLTPDMAAILIRHGLRAQVGKPC
ncbi:glycosyltransferase family 2 protein [Puniceibacterium sp. IMCC21224]|uniref:glycosyltransferase family 2 protein n=1 Tax=Puniceibacterium sp. IMCC21224 TaxID=1618204 RepID=UPI00069E47BF|nr:glycosyltransferase family 2 protein [Puniceibacterium sp. IMCC21224]